MHCRPILGLLIACLLAVSAAAQTTYTWSGLAGDSVFTNPGNWIGNVAPTGNATDNIVFPQLPPQFQAPPYAEALINAPVNVGHITFDGSYYFFYLTGTGPITLNGNLTANNVGTSGVPMILTAGNHIFNGTSTFFQSANLTGTGGLIKNGTGTLGLFGSGNTFSGGFVMNAGTVVINSSSALGNGPITLNGGTLTANSGSTIQLSTNIVIGADVTFGTNIDDGGFYIGNGDGSDLTPAAGVTTVNLSLDYFSQSVYLTSDLLNGTAATTYTFARNTNEDSAFYLSGSNTYTGGTLVKNGGAVVFEYSWSVPTTGLVTAEPDGYVAAGTPAVQATLLSRLDPATFAGTIGFQDNYTYTDPINLTNFSANGGTASIGTMNSATLTGLITPSVSSNEYLFRSSGTIFLAGTNPLSGSNGLVSTSLDEALKPGLVVLRQSVANTYTGVTTADGAGITFDSTGSLPASTVIDLANGGYVSVTNTSELSVANLVDKIGNHAGSNVIGFDTTNGINGIYQDFTHTNPVSFSALTSDVYLGTASQKVTFSGALTTANGNTGDYFLTGYGIGHLVLSSQLTGSKALHVGVAEGQFGTVQLTHTGNTYTGGTVLNAGSLIVSSPASLGTGTITSTPFDGAGPVYLEGPSSSTLTNNFVLNPGMLSLYWGFATLSGTITGTGGLHLYSDMTLTGANSYVGGTELYGIQVTAGANSALGSGYLSLIEGAHLTFNTAAPQIGSLLNGSTYYYDDDGIIEYASFLTFATSAPATLTINQTEDGTFEGSLGQGTGVGSLVKNGSGTLIIGGHVGLDDSPPTPYSGGTTINAGKLIAGSPTALGTGPITINGGTLGTSVGVTLANAITFGGSGGRLGGNGSFGAPITAGANVALAPGESPGILTFNAGLTLASGGSLEFEIQSAVGAPGTGYDLVSISGGALAITATAGSPFTIKVASLDLASLPGDVPDFSSSVGYTWMIFEGNSGGGITGFAANKFLLDSSLFTNDLNGGVFSLTLGTNGVNPALFLNFSPVPEPTTYVLLALGLGPVLLRLRRRRA